jgi:hypothetical protein
MSYLPGSQKSIRWAPEIIMLFWELLQCNKNFRSFIVDTDRANDFLILILFYALEHKEDPSQHGVVRMCVFVLQTMSVEPSFGKGLNKRFGGQSTLPASVRLDSFRGSYADYLVIVSYLTSFLRAIMLILTEPQKVYIQAPNDQPRKITSHLSGLASRH